MSIEDHEPEPSNPARALERVESDHHFTLKTLQTHKGHGTMTGGYGGLYMLLQQDGYFASLLTHDLVAEGKALVAEERALERQANVTAAKLFNIRFGRKSLVDALEGYAPNFQDEVCAKATELFRKDPKALSHFERQAAYEERVIAHLKYAQGCQAEGSGADKR
jgi:hypothetical protein